jgi:outer membrane protein OmpA-like peptidoglycan-associated protein
MKLMTNKTYPLLASLSLAGLLTACAHSPPQQLIDARAAYDVSANGPAAQLAPTDLYDARKSLDMANGEYASNGDKDVILDYAYMASRKIELADSKARTEADRMQIADAIKQGVVVRDQQVTAGKIALADSRAQLHQERRDNQAATGELLATNAAQGKELDKASAQLNQTSAQLNQTSAQLNQTSAQLDKTAAQLEDEKAARVVAEARLAGAMKDLATIAAIKQEPRGLVITLSGSVLFASGKFALLETAKVKLDQVAEALKQQDGDRKMLVEGHTDSRGSDAINLPLSLSRASAVRDYLVERGVDANRISAVGLGASRPLMDNRNAENRANNRRVEIIVKPRLISAR